MSLLGCCCFLHAFKRGQLREKYGLEENTCGDCFITCCCAPCALCQEARELKARGKIFENKQTENNFDCFDRISTTTDYCHSSTGIIDV